MIHITVYKINGELNVYLVNEMQILPNKIIFDKNTIILNTIKNFKINNMYHNDYKNSNIFDVIKLIQNKLEHITDIVIQLK